MTVIVKVSSNAASAAYCQRHGLIAATVTMWRIILCFVNCYWEGKGQV